MPLYAYQCTNCGVSFERQQKFDDKPVKKCPECGKNTVRRVIQPAGIIFKGSGWYKTDSKSSSSSSSSSSKNKKSDSASASSDSSSSDSKSSESKSTEAKSTETKTTESKASSSKSSSDE